MENWMSSIIFGVVFGIVFGIVFAFTWVFTRRRIGRKNEQRPSSNR